MKIFILIERYLFNCACLAIRLAVLTLLGMLLHDPSAVLFTCEDDKAAVLDSSSDKLSSKKTKKKINC